MSAVSMPMPRTCASSRTIGWAPSRGCCCKPLQTRGLDLSDLPGDKRRRAISRRNSASVFGGSGVPSGVRNVSSRAAASAQVRLEAANAEPSQCALDAVDDARALADQLLALAAWPFGVLLLKGRDRDHAAMVALAAQPAEKGPLQQLGIEPIGLRPAMLARHGDTVAVDHLGFDAARPQPTRQPEAVAAGLEGDRNPADCAPGLRRLVPPAMQQPKQRRLASGQLFQRLAFDPGNNRRQPASSTGSSRSPRSTCYPDPERRGDRLRSFDLWHGAPRRLFAATMVPFSSPLAP